MNNEAPSRYREGEGEELFFSLFFLKGEVLLCDYVICVPFLVVINRSYLVCQTVAAPEADYIISVSHLILSGENGDTRERWAGS